MEGNRPWMIWYFITLLYFNKQKKLFPPRKRWKSLNRSIYLFVVTYYDYLDKITIDKVKKSLESSRLFGTIACLSPLYGAANRIWTGDLFLTKEVLYLLSHSSIILTHDTFFNVTLCYYIWNDKNCQAEKTLNDKIFKTIFYFCSKPSFLEKRQPQKFWRYRPYSLESSMERRYPPFFLKSDGRNETPVCSCNLYPISLIQRATL